MQRRGWEADDEGRWEEVGGEKVRGNEGGREGEKLRRRRKMRA